MGANEVTGSTTSGFFCGAADKYTVYFDIVFDQPFTASQVRSTSAGQSSPNVVFLTFDDDDHPGFRPGRRCPSRT